MSFANIVREINFQKALKQQLVLNSRQRDNKIVSAGLRESREPGFFVVRFPTWQ